MKVVYVAGSMRSGTTLVAELLGSFKGAVAIGELNNLSGPTRAGQRCSCGKEPRACDLWGPVFAELFAGTELETIWDLRRHLERQRRLPELFALARRPESDWPSDVVEYVAFLRSSVELLLAVSGAQSLIDSSKSACGLALMRLAHPDQLAVLHLLRNPRGVAYSESHHVHTRDHTTAAPPSVRSIVSSASGWDTTNLECYLLSRRVGLATTTWYEWLCDDPAERFEIVARRLGLEGEGPEFEGGRVRLGGSHVLAGNPSRTGPDWRVVQCDDAWREGLSPRERSVIGLLVWPLEVVLRHSSEASRERPGRRPGDLRHRRGENPAGQDRPGRGTT